MNRFHALLLAAVAALVTLCWFAFLRSEPISPDGLTKVTGPANVKTPALAENSGTEKSRIGEPIAERPDSERDSRQEVATLQKEQRPAANGKRPIADPEMKKVLQAEAASGAERTVDALLDSGLAKELGLTEENRAALRALLVQRAGLVWEQILIPMAAGELKGERLAAAGRNVKEAVNANSARIRDLLGPEGYARYEWYDKTQPDRDAVKDLAPQFKKSGFDLSSDQQRQLAAMIIEERKNFPFQHDFPGPAEVDYSRFHEIFTSDRADLHFTEVKAFNQRLADRVQAVLDPDQVNLFRELMDARLQRAKLTVRTTMAMMEQSK